MHDLVILAHRVTFVFLFALILTVFSKLASGKISLTGLLTGDRKDGSDYFSVGRAQLLASMLIVVVTYFRHLTEHPLPTSLPDLPAGALKLMGCSYLFYLVGKARALWFGPSAPNSQKGDL